LRVDNDLADQIVAAWLKQHIQWTLEGYSSLTHEEDKIEAAADYVSMRRLLQYVTGEIDDMPIHPDMKGKDNDEETQPTTPEGY
jgi:hypothetical protein